MIRDFLCWLGWFHPWNSVPPSGRVCRNCRKRQFLRRSNDEFGDRDPHWEDE